MAKQLSNLMVIERLKKLINSEKNELEIGGLQTKIKKLIDEMEDPDNQPFNAVQKIINGFHHFMAYHYNPKVALGQHPKFLVFSCSDSRVSPSHVHDFEPGTAVMVCNIANLIPAFDQVRYSEVGAAIEYAVQKLEVTSVLVMGHSHCGGIKRLMELPNNDFIFPLKNDPNSTTYEFIDDWVRIALPAKVKVQNEHPNLSPEKQTEECEKEAVNLSLVNIQSYPYVRSAMAANKLALRGGYYNFVNGTFELWEIQYQITNPITIGK